MDESVGRIVQAIKAKGYGYGSAAAAEHAAGAEFDPHLWSNSLLIFTVRSAGVVILFIDSSPARIVYPEDTL